MLSVNKFNNDAGTVGILYLFPVSLDLFTKQKSGYFCRRPVGTLFCIKDFIKKTIHNINNYYGLFLPGVFLIVIRII